MYGQNRERPEEGSTREAKYRLTDETKTTESGVVLRRICALRDIQRWSVRKGDSGGWVESESNLSQYGDAWIGDNAMVYGNAQVYGDAKVYGNAQVYEDAEIYGYAKIYGYALVRDNAVVRGNAVVGGNATVGGNAIVGGNAMIGGGAVVGENARVRGNAAVSGVACLAGDAVVCSSADYLVFRNSWSSYRWFTYTRSNKMWKVGCFYGTGEDLIKKAYADSVKSGRCYEAIVRAAAEIESATAEKEGAE